jgi:DNA repair exonuclease SbcCD ATPase subunit
MKEKQETISCIICSSPDVEEIGYKKYECSSCKSVFTVTDDNNKTQLEHKTQLIKEKLAIKKPEPLLVKIKTAILALISQEVRSKVSEYEQRLQDLAAERAELSKLRAQAKIDAQRYRSEAEHELLEQKKELQRERKELESMFKKIKTLEIKHREIIENYPKYKEAYHKFINYKDMIDRQNNEIKKLRLIIKKKDELINTLRSKNKELLIQLLRYKRQGEQPNGEA